MARERFVTRTVEVNNYKVMCLDVTTAQVETSEYQLTGANYDNASALKVLKKQYETDTYKLVAVQETTTTEILYGMPEIDFIKYAKVLPARGSKDEEN